MKKRLNSLNICLTLQKSLSLSPAAGLGHQNKAEC
jgi:hypothetical protein